MDIAKSIISRRFKIKAPAKVNLSLRITGRLDNGFHTLSMLNAATQFGDEIDIQLLPHSNREIEVTGSQAKSNLPSIEANLITKAINRVFGEEVGFHIILKKEIPIGGGLGGGSSNAGAILRLAEFLNPQLKNQMQALSLELGSDVPYFLSPYATAVVEGVGGAFIPQYTVKLSTFSIFLVFPNFSILTPDAYRWYKETNTTFSSPLNLGDWRNVVGENDLLAPVLNHHPELGKLLAELRTISPLSGMSGSGSTLFALTNGDSDLPEIHNWAARHKLSLIRTTFIETFPSPVEVTS